MPTAIYLKQVGRIYAGTDNLVHVDAVGDLPPMVFSRSVALAAARALLGAVAELEQRDDDAPEPIAFAKADDLRRHN